MNTPDSAAPAGPSLIRDWLYALRYWLGGRRGAIALLVLLAALGIGLGWSWLVAVGIAPLLVAVLPCAAMCALGVCASRFGGRSCSSQAEAKAPTPEPPFHIQASMRAPAAGQEPAPPVPYEHSRDASERVDFVQPSEPSDERRT